MVTQEKRIERKVVIWVDPKRKHELKFIGSLIEILQTEIPALANLRNLFKDISSHLLLLGWPIKLEFNVKTNIYVTMNIKNSVILPETECPPAHFTIPK